MTLRVLHAMGLALNVVGTGMVFVFAYPPREERRAAFFVALSRLAILLIFFGFLLQLVAALLEGS